MATIHHISSGKLDGSVYINGWPQFSAVVCQYKGTFSQWVCGSYHDSYSVHIGMHIWAPRLASNPHVLTNIHYDCVLTLNAVLLLLHFKK